MTKYAFNTNDVTRASFQFDGSFSLFRHVQEAGTSTYLREGYKGEVIAEVVNPTMSFAQWVHEHVSAELKEVSK